MKIETVEIVSNETIKPSSSTPDHLRHYKLSFLDQINPPVYMPLVLFYPADDQITNSERSDRLKKSLSEALTRFYPLAGRLVDNSYVDCNDEGVPYVEARAVNCTLSDVVDDPVPNELNKLLPCKLDEVEDISVVIQATFFDCGGMAVGLGISHKIADALSFFMFLNTWAAISRGETDLPSPKFESATFFPPRDVAGFKPTTGIVNEGIVTRRFIFPASKIAELRDKFADNNNNNTEHPAAAARRPTRIEALSAFVWSRYMAATGAKADNPNKIYTVLHAVNLRPRVDPPLPDYYFGNISRLAIAIPSLENSKDVVHGVLSKVREAIRNVNGEYVSKVREGDKHLNFIKERAERVTRGEVVSFSFTSLCRFPIYEADFGWGRPVWVGSASLTFKNLVVFLDTRSGDGIEAWVNLKEEDMAKFEVDEELLSFVSSADNSESKLISGF